MSNRLQESTDRLMAIGLPIIDSVEVDHDQKEVLITYFVSVFCGEYLGLLDAGFAHRSEKMITALEDLLPLQIEAVSESEDVLAVFRSSAEVYVQYWFSGFNPEALKLKPVILTPSDY